jgi:hypothetical protein
MAAIQIHAPELVQQHQAIAESSLYPFFATVQ